MLEAALAHPADMAVFDALRHLSTYLSEAHVAGKHHLADLYEIVQYAGNILPVSLPTKAQVTGCWADEHHPASSAASDST
jgi:hypothetical protein